MKLHEDKFAFLNIINLIHEASSIRADILEKDYYVTLLLRELAGKQVTLPAYFKGGTALYKAQKSIRRFSEDIDLTVCIDNCSNSQAKKRLEMATKKYQALPRTSRKDLEDDRKGSITTVYDYTPLVGVDSDDPLQRFGYVKVEGTSFTVSEPFTPLEIEPILYTYATEEQRNILQSQYNVAPFMINTIRLERIFADKIFAAEFYYERKMYFDVAKHLYDVSVMFDLEQIQEMIQNQQTFLEMLGYKRRGTPCCTYRYRMWILAGCVLFRGAPCFCFALNLLAHGFQPYSSNIPPGHRSESNRHSLAGHCR